MSDDNASRGAQRFLPEDEPSPSEEADKPTDAEETALQFIRTHLALIFGGIPLTMAIWRLIIVSRGDAATLSLLVQNLNLTTILVFTLVTTAPAWFVYLAELFLIEVCIRFPARSPLFLSVATIGISFLIAYFISWVLALWWMAGSAIILLLAFLNKPELEGTDMSDFRNMTFLTARRVLIPIWIVLMSLQLLIFPQVPWLVAERITLADGTVRVGYVVSAGNPMTVLWREGGIVYLEAGAVKARQPCQRTDRDAAFPMSGRLFDSSSATPACPSKKLSR